MFQFTLHGKAKLIRDSLRFLLTQPDQVLSIKRHSLSCALVNHSHPLSTAVTWVYGRQNYGGIRYRLPDYRGPVSCDRDLIEEVLENLVKNAIEAQGEGGFLKINLYQEGSNTIVVFENPGFSLTAKEAGRIIEPYFTTKTRGTGLGLSIARRIIHAHGGRFEIEVPKEGLLRVSVYLPSAYPKRVNKEVVPS